MALSINGGLNSGSLLSPSGLGGNFDKFVQASQPKESELLPVADSLTVDYASTHHSTILSPGVQMESATIDERYNAWTKVNVVFSCSNQQKLLDFITPVIQSPTPVLRFTLRTIAPNGYTRPPALHWITSYRLVYAPGAGTYMLRLETADMLFAMNRLIKTAIRRGTITEVFNALIGEGFGTGIMSAVVDESAQPIRYVQSFQSDFDFILNRLVPRAISSQDQTGDWRLQQKGMEIIFGPLGFAKRRPTLYNMRSRVTGVTDIEYADRSQLSFPFGGAGVRASIVSPVQNTVAQPSSLNDGVQMPAPGTGLTAAPADGIGAYPLCFTAPEDLSEPAALVQNRFLTERAHMYSTEYTAKCMPQVQIGDYINVVASPDVPKQATGPFYVAALHHEIISGALTTRLVADRGETYVIGDSFQSTPVLDPNLSPA